MLPFFSSFRADLLTNHHQTSPDRAQRRLPEERGPFGRSSRRRTPSRSKASTPSRTKEDKDAQENWRVIDDIFSRANKQDEERAALAQSTAGAVALIPASGAEPQTDARTGQSQSQGTPTEIALSGFPPAFQYAAIEYYERISGGCILEDYDRAPPNARFDLSLSLSRSRGSTSLKLSKEALRKKNSYAGGKHWIKVTFDSAEAADQALAGSPHTIRGYLVTAQPFRGGLPRDQDVAVPATTENVASATASPGRSSTTLQPVNGSSATLSSATATGTVARSGSSTMSTSSTLQLQGPASPTSPPATSTAPSSPTKALRLRGAKPIPVKDASEALLPAKGRLQRTFGTLPVVGWIVSGKIHDGFVGDLPRRDDGTIDWDRASLYWRFWGSVDDCFGTEFCGGGKDD
jgi:hypothetical protein